MTPLTQSSVIGFAGRVASCCDPGPVIERVTQPAIAGIAHDHGTTLATLHSYRCYSSMSAQSVIISFGKRPRGLGEHRGGYDSSHSWQRPEDLNVAVRALPAFITL